MLRELDRQDCDALLARNRIGRIGVRDHDSVYVVPLCYAFRDGCIYLHSAPGRKLVLVQRWPMVAFQVDEIQSTQVWRSVLVHGHCELIDDEAERVQARLLLLHAFEGSLMAVTSGHGHATTFADAYFLRLRVDEISGRAENL
jgi:nitroimidazol reductase NimA-like FMN-containing flavoprotein (pyridoxamine 5'-phosphate oxidase superfamily)